MLKKIKEKLEDRKRQKQLEHLRELMEPPKPRPKPAAKSAKRR